MARNRPNSAPVTLFPFLAVLMCTMGALIVLLVLVSAQVRDDAVARAKAEQERKAEADIAEIDIAETATEKPTATTPVLPMPEPDVTPLPPEPNLDALRRSLADLHAQQKSLQSVLSEREANLAALQAAAEQARRERTLSAARREKTETQVKLAAQTRDAVLTEVSRLDTERRRLLTAIIDSKKLIEERQRELNAKSEFVIVPFDGQRGTTRRPIIIECTDRSIRFVSEEIQLTPPQLLGFTPQSNPLLAGANEIVRYWSSYNSVQDDPDSEPVPYVLLVVRPSGTVAFYLARKFLNGLGADYGYELVEEDFEYAAPPADPRAKEMALAAITQMLAAGPSRHKAETFSESLAGGGRFSGRNGQGDRGEGAGGSGTESGRDSGTFSGLTDSGRDLRPFDSRVLRHGTRSASQGFFSSDTFRRHQRNAGPRIDPSGGGPSGSGSNTEPASGSARGQPSGSETGSEGQPGPSTSGRTGAANAPNGLRSTPQLGGLAGSSSLPAVPKPFEFSTGPEPLIAGPSSQRARETASAPDPVPSPLGGEGARRAGEGEAESGISAPTASSTAPSSGLRPPSPRGGEGTDSVRKSARSLNGQPGGTLPPTGSPSTTPSSSIALPVVTPPQNPPRAASRRPAREYRRQWGIQNPGGTIALERPVVIRADREKVVIGGRFKITRTVDRSPGHIVEWTVLATDRVARNWGVPPQRFYWVPAVTLIVDPGGELLRGPLEDKLRRSGVSVETRFSDGAVTPAVRPGGTP